jgi:hypothetical protein
MVVRFSSIALGLPLGLAFHTSRGHWLKPRRRKHNSVTAITERMTGFEELIRAGAVREGGHAMTSAEIAILSVLIAVVVVSVWLGFLHREF